MKRHQESFADESRRLQRRAEKWGIARDALAEPLSKALVAKARRSSRIEDRQSHDEKRRSWEFLDE